MSIRRIRYWLLGIAGVFLLGVVYLFLLPFDVTPFLRYDSSFALYDREGTLLSVLRSPRDSFSIPIPLEEMGEWLPKVAVESEDRRFFRHPGVDILALGRALFTNLRSRRIVSGASTITTQLVRLLFPRPRTLTSKLWEYLVALRLERHLGKKAILESYLNRIPLGGNIYGVEAASWYYFGKKAKDLSFLEAVSLVSLFPAPERFRPDKNPENFLRRRNALLARLHQRGLITQEEYLLYTSAPCPKPRGLPQAAYHAAVLLEKMTSSSRVRSTLVFPLQAMLERALEEAVVTLPEGITACGVIVENETGHILAYVGNARFRRTPEKAFVDCLQAPRSPGSALKPFVYARAFDRGLFVPSSIVPDTPYELGGNVPRNFDLGFRGLVSCEVALALSLNVPAVRVARKVGLRDCLDLFQALGFSRITKDETFYGDSLILGGCEVTPFELARGYTALSRLGEEIELTFFPEDTPTRKRVFSEGSAYMIAEILADSSRFNPLPKKTLPLPLCAFKTGTSYGLRDAWTVAYNPRYTVLVWFGDPKGLPHEELVGIRLAAPVSIRLMEYLMRGERVWYRCPEDIKWREVCTLSGKIASPFCEHRTAAPFLRNVSPLEVCSLHTPSLGTLRPSKETPLAIVSPIPGRKYFLLPPNSKLRLPLRAEGGRGRIFWFLDGEYVGESAPDESLFVAVSPGTHTVLASDASGGSATVTFTLEAGAFARTRNDLGEIWP
ncbi:MAG: penicillin-binding protein 1C [Candidatus Caldatribacterium sp.]|nr:penicillin-binding protein 1C [Candidatus Caldatribacterium sp.]